MQPPFNENTTLDDMVLALHNANVNDGDCETLLFMQARVLDAIFGRLTVKALKAVNSSDDVDDDRMNLALRAQRQSRVTISSLSAVQSRKEKARKEEEKIFAKELKDRENFW